MKYLYWICTTIVLLLGVGFSVFMGIQPKSVPKIRYSHFEHPDKLADAIILRMNQELKGYPLIMLGVMPGRPHDLEVWKAFLAQSSVPGVQYQALVIDPELPGAAEMFPSAVKIDLKRELDRFIEGAKNARTQGIRMAVIAPTIYTTQILKENPSGVIIKTTDLRPASFSIMGFARNPEEEQKQEIRCVMGEGDRDGLGPLGCVAQNKARLSYRKEADPAKFEGLMDLVGERDYLILFNAP
ncbi:MAG: hypothetical protein H7326_02370 [Bdellovibrionaceae bacterium]|nr:hypothetical protein [Pseudobdellovibrionaceae bacterium]